MNVFISYCAADDEAARHFARLLRAHGFNAFRDADGIRMREAHEARILEAVREAEAILLLLSTRAASRPWVQSEVFEGQSLGARVIVMRLERCGLPEWVVPTRVIDRFTSPDEADLQLLTCVRRLSRSTSSHVGR